ncbi:cation diffusion facilitator family transporter ASCRUDRAFT_17996, partial [Ascoidea rubescens DSM 1968]
INEMRPKRLIGNKTSHQLINWSIFEKDNEKINQIKNKNLKKYYIHQNKLINKYLIVDKILDSGLQISMLNHYARLSSRKNKVPADIDLEISSILGNSYQENSTAILLAILVNYIINIVLLIGKIFVTVLTSSLSITASLVDSCLDFLSTTIIYITNKLSTSSDWKSRIKYPIGRARLEPIGVLVFSIIIIISFLEVIRESLVSLFNNKNKNPIEIGKSSVLIMGSTILIKFLCWLYCKSIKSSSIEALTQDAMTDVIFNSFSLLMPLIGSKLNIWWVDPISALFLSVYIVIAWSLTALNHINNLTGSKASKFDEFQILYLVLRFADTIERITKINCYHVGDNINVEIDIMLNPDLNLKDSHDIGEAVQYAIETLPTIERCFVHLDYRAGNYDGHI